MNDDERQQSKRDRIRAEKERRDRLAYIGTLAAALVHEMRTPLHAIRMNVDLLGEDLDLLPDKFRDRLHRKIGRVSEETHRLSKTLEEFLTFARPPRLDPVPTDLNHVLREVVEFSEPEFMKAGVSIEIQLADDMYPVVLDYAQFLHVMLNLFRNARESIEEAGRQDGLVCVATRELDTLIEVVVEDNGAGISPGDEDRIFETFESTKEHGTGLGLAIVRRILEDHGGVIRAENRNDGPGARFIIDLPRGKFLEFKEDPGDNGSSAQ